MLCSTVLFFQACNDDDDTSASKGEVEFEITDAPSDDASIKGVFVTVSDIKVDGKSIGMTQKQTVDLKAYSNGATKILSNSQIDAKAYSSVTLVLDNATDASGNTPGNYVQTIDNAKYSLNTAASGTTEITLTKTWEVQENAKSNVVFDVDLRKAIRTSDNATIKYQFVTDEDLKSAIRVVRKDQTGSIEGTYSESFATNADLVVAYAYKKGEFNSTTETTADADGTLFKHAVASADVKKTSNAYKFSFIESGDYEIAFAVYSKNTTNDHYDFKTLLKSETTINGSATDKVHVDAGVNVKIFTSITGLL